MKEKALNTWESWVIAVACCIILCLVVTLYRLSSIFYAELIVEYKVDRDTASIPFAIMGLVKCLSGLFLGILAERFGMQRMIYLGCYLSALGAGLSYFAHNVTTLTITIGVFYGIGFSSTALLPNVIRGHFDDTATTISNGLLLVGPCLTAIVFPAAIYLFIEKYGLSGSFLLTSGIILNAIPFIMLLDPSRYSSNYRKTINSKPKTNQGKQLQDFKDLEEQDTLLNTEDNSTNSKNNKENDGDKRLSLHDDKVNAIRVTTPSIPKTTPKCSLHEKEVCSCIEVSNVKDECELKNVSQQKVIEEMTNPIPNNSDCLPKTDIDIENSDSLKQISLRDITNTSTSKDEKHKIKKKGFFYSLNVFKDPTFLALSLIQGLYAYSYHMWLTTMIDYSRDKGIDHSYEIYLLSINPITDIAGRLGLARITDKGYLSVTNYCAILFIVLALSSILIAVAADFAIMLLGVMLNTFTLGAFLSVIPGMSYAFIEKDKQAVSVASLGIFYAPLSFTVAPLTGYFRGDLGSYDGLYYLLAAMNFACSLLVLFLPKLANRRERIKRKKLHNSELFEIS